MSTLNICLIVLAVVLGAAWYTRRRNRIRREKHKGR